MEAKLLEKKFGFASVVYIVIQMIFKSEPRLGSVFEWQDTFIYIDDVR